MNTPDPTASGPSASASEPGPKPGPKPGPEPAAPDHSSACEALLALRAVLARLRGPDGCPWDRAQTPQKLAEYVIEESHELAAALRQGDTDAICEELGDVAFLLLFLAGLFEDAGAFTLTDALDRNRAKMIRRHPHVFAGEVFADLDAQLARWEAIKREEHTAPDGPAPGLYAGLPPTLPPLLMAYRIHSKAARVGFTWPEDEEVERQVEAEWLEWLDAAAAGDDGAQRHELGDMLFTLVELGRRRGIRASEALDMACGRFLRRFACMEALARERGQDFVALALDDKDELWNEAKAREAGTENASAECTGAENACAADAGADATGATDARAGTAGTAAAPADQPGPRRL